MDKMCHAPPIIAPHLLYRYMDQTHILSVYLLVTVAELTPWGCLQALIF